MKKIFAAVALVCLVLTSFCQSRTAIFQGRTVKVFPYRIQVESYSDHDFDNLRMDKLAVPYCPEKLEDGEYIIYFKPEIDLNDDRSIERFAKGDTIYVAINYSIKNGIKDGPVFFL